TRTLFAYSFDRVIPSKFTDVSGRCHTPVFSIVFTMMIGIIVTILANYTFFYGTYLTNTSLGYIIATMIVAVAAIKFPYGKTRALFEGSPGITRARIGRLPVITLAGAITLITFGYVAYEGFTTPAIGGVISPYSFIGGLILPFVIPWIIYYVARSYRKSRGIQLDLAFKEIPPE